MCKCDNRSGYSRLDGHCRSPTRIWGRPISRYRSGPQPPPNPKQNPIGAVAHLALSIEAGTSVILSTNNRVLDTWRNIHEAEAKEDVLLGKIQENLDKMDAVINPARSIQKYVKENLQKVMSLMRRTTSSKEATGKIKSSFELILRSDSDRRSQCSEVSVQTSVSEVRRKERSLSSVVIIKRRRKKRIVCAISVPKDRRDEPKQSTARTADTMKWL